MMTLQLKRCVSLFVCLSLLLSACSPDKSSKAGNKVNEFNRITKVDKDSIEKMTNHVTSTVNKNNVTPVSFWNREIGKVGGFSVTPTKVAIGITTVVVVGGGIWWLGHKKGWWKKPLIPEEQQKYDAHKLREERLKDKDLSLEILTGIVEELSPEAIVLEPNEEIRNQMTEQTNLAYQRLQERLHELSHPEWNQTKQNLPADVANKMDEEWIKNSIFITVPPPGSSLVPSIEEINALKKAEAMLDVNDILEGAEDEDTIERDVSNWSLDAKDMFNPTVNAIKQQTAILTPSTAHRQTKLILHRKNLNRVLEVHHKNVEKEEKLKFINDEDDKEERKRVEEEKEQKFIDDEDDKEERKRVEEEKEQKFIDNELKREKIAQEAETTLPQNTQDMLKKYISAKTMATKLRTLRNLGNEWDNKKIRQDFEDRMLATYEIAALNAIMAVINETALENIMIKTMFNIKGSHVPDDIWLCVFR
ncbi:MAG: hypothetical protein LE178_06050 [Endomicrobium sp.]|nr:hypothetical protein [Endomicrobium sp.]